MNKENRNRLSGNREQVDGCQKGGRLRVGFKKVKGLRSTN